MSFLDVLESVINNTDDIETKLKFTKIYGKILWANNQGIYSANHLEKKLISEIRTSYKPNLVYARKKNVFVLSVGYLSGGHTRLMENLSCMLNKECDLIITGITDTAVRTRLQNYFSEVYQIQTYTSFNVDDVYMLSDMFCSYENIILNIHPDDIISVIAAGLAKQVNSSCVHFINHADHVFSFGAYVSDIWYQISQFGAVIDNRRDLQGKTSFLGIPITKSLQKKESPSIVDNKDVELIITSGSANKFKPQKNKSLVNKIPHLLRQFPNATVNVVGANIKFDYWWWPVLIKNKSRIKFFKSLNYNDYLSLMDKADLYIDSHPIPGGTAFVEQYLSGNVCAGYKSPQQGYTPLEEVKSHIDAEEITIGYDDDILKKVEFVHSFDNVKERFSQSINYGITTSINWDDYYTWSGDVEFFKKNKITVIPADVLCDVCKNTAIMRYALNYNIMLIIKSAIIWLVKKITS